MCLEFNYLVLNSNFDSQTSARSFRSSGDEGTRTPGPCLAKAVLSQLSYIPIKAVSYQSSASSLFTLPLLIELITNC